ncbi:proteasome subunit beta type 4 [Heterostelium album PN500]|uniref:Proteasome subunit beta n=1 Tax=Heterostelium pallidum (strain ATCC 26659 / Pp 5 / PN500) TaxID=670386 RepID=D3AZF9_HETP5|nr:proteasome subunit beta type 4 [Heterostelium album PN500]EFA85542.1 proteasome subunit beta type 4 [Heterostelium album PN500]|eukprot:XP_020437650.1 proteasome subunit beta type 4 [Heterostelium album PN500]
MSSKHFRFPVFGQVDYFGQPQHSAASYTPSEEKQRTTDPIVTGSSVIAIKYNGGVVMGCDTLCSYGSLARFNNIQRVKQFGPKTIVGYSGEHSDFQSITQLLDDLVIDDQCIDDKSQLSTEEIWNYLARVLYNRRNKVDPLWNNLVVMGFDKKTDKSFLGKVDLYGTCFKDDYIATGYGQHIALPLLRKAYSPDMTLEQAQKLITDCLRVLFYRDARSSKRVQLSYANANGMEISAPIELETYNWDIGEAAVKSFDQV